MKDENLENVAGGTLLQRTLQKHVGNKIDTNNLSAYRFKYVFAKKSNPKLGLNDLLGTGVKYVSSESTDDIFGTLDSISTDSSLLFGKQTTCTIIDDYHREYKVVLENGWEIYECIFE